MAVQGNRVGHMIWWSTNTRAAAVLAELSHASQLPTFLVVDPEVPPPTRSILQKSVVVERRRRPATAKDFTSLLAIGLSQCRVDQMVLAPTSEYLLDALRSARAHLPSNVVHVLPTSTEDYGLLSSKTYFTHLHPLPASQLPDDLKGTPAEMPFVAKPTMNVVGGETLKPFLVSDLASFGRFDSHRDAFFPQSFVAGGSVYWCGYRARNGEVTSYYQRNLLQQSGGGSIARATFLNDDEVGDGYRAIASRILKQLAAVDFRGPFMVEMRGYPPRFIELNPRFWGPLLLAESARTQVVPAYFHDNFGIEMSRSPNIPTSRSYVVPSLVREAVPVDWSLDEGARGNTQQICEDSVQDWQSETLGGQW